MGGAPLNWFAMLVMWSLIAVAFARLPGLWSTGMPKLLQHMRAFWPYGDRALFHWGRGIPMMAVATMLLTFGATLSLADELLARAFGGSSVRAIELGLFALAGATVLLGIVVIVTGRPRALVPPSLRNAKNLDEAVRVQSAREGERR